MNKPAMIDWVNRVRNKERLSASIVITSIFYLYGKNIG